MRNYRQFRHSASYTDPQFKSNFGQRPQTIEPPKQTNPEKPRIIAAGSAKSQVIAPLSTLSTWRLISERSL